MEHRREESPMTKSFLNTPDVDGFGDKSCVAHSVFMCNQCLLKEVERLRMEHGAVVLALAEVGNIIGGPVGAMSDDYRLDEARKRMARASDVVVKALVSPDGLSLRERLSDLCHQQWSNWMLHLFSQCEKHSDRMIIPAWACKRWRQQMATPYSGLSVEEKDSDRGQADKFIALLGKP